jgi:hypothetical protein
MRLFGEKIQPFPPPIAGTKCLLLKAGMQSIGIDRIFRKS